MKPLKALIVEDSPNDEELLLRQLARAEYNVDSVRVQTAADLKKALAERDWDIVLSDYAMPGFTGLEALRVLKESRQPDIPLIIISGTIGENTAVEAMRLGINDYLLKGNLARLVPAIERELESSAARRAQKQAEESLRRSEASLADAQRIAHIGSWENDLVNNRLFWSDEVYRIFGVTKDNFGATFESFISFIHPKDRSAVQAAADAALRQNASYNIEHRIIRPDGEVRYVREIGEVNFDETGEPLRFIGTVQDITERKAAEGEMRLMKSAIDSIGEGIIITDEQKPDNPIIYANAAYEKLTGYAFEEIKGLNCRFLQGADTNPRTIDSIRETLEQATTFRGEILNYHKNGEPFWNELMISPVFDQSGRLTNFVGIQQDITERKQVEAALQESEKRYRYLTDAMPQLVWATDKNGSHYYYNQQWYDFTGLTEEESLGFGFTNALHPDDKGRTLSRWERAWRNGEGYEIEYRFFSKPLDEYRWFLGRAMPVRNESEEIIQWVGTCTDIEDQKRAEERVRLADLRVLAEYDCLLDRISLLGESFGTARDLQTIFQALHTFAIDSTHCDSIFVSLFDQERQLRIPSYIRWRNEEFDVSEFPPMPMNDSPHSRAVSTGSTIITDDFQAAVEGQPAIHIGLDKDPNLPQSSLAVPMKIMGRIIGAVEIQSTEKAAFTKEHATALRMAANLTANAIENVRLLEQERIKEEQLRQSQKLESVGLLAGGIAHDFNNMLTAINGYSDLTLRRLDAASPLWNNIKEIKKAGERSAELTHQLLAFSRQQILQPKVFDINETIDETSKMLRRLIGEDIELQLHLNPKVVPIKADPGQLTQVIMNLAVNARDAMPTGGVITIQTDNVHLDDKFVQTHSPMEAGNYVMVSVTDTGSGMDELTRERIFEPFFTTKKAGEGTGLGLATVYGIVKQSGGYIWVESQIQKGTTFTVYFPPAEASNLPQDLEDTDPIVKTGTETILLVEDEEIVRTLTRQMLEECGYQVLDAASGTEALELYSHANCRIDLLMTDVVMPNMGGRQLAENLIAKFPDIKILFTSGYTNDDMVRHRITETGQNFIQKPFAFEDLAQKIREILDSN